MPRVHGASSTSTAAGSHAPPLWRQLALAPDPCPTASTRLEQADAARSCPEQASGGSELRRRSELRQQAGGRRHYRRNGTRANDPGGRGELKHEPSGGGTIKCQAGGKHGCHVAGAGLTPDPNPTIRRGVYKASCLCEFSAHHNQATHHEVGAECVRACREAVTMDE